MKASDHVRLTRIALEHAILAWPELKQALEVAADDLLWGAAKEDWHPPCTRYRNWHFWAPLDPVRDGQVGGTSTCSRRRLLSLLIDHAQTPGTTLALRRDRARLAGRILHHIQDMSTPSHALPVYHHFLNPDPYEGGLKAWLKQNPPQLNPTLLTLAQPTLRPSENEQQIPWPGKPTPTCRALHALYDSTALATITLIKETPLLPPAPETLSVFWLNESQNYDPKQGLWGECNRKQWGNTTVQMDADPAHTRSVPRSRYEELYALFNVQCVRTSAQALWLLAKAESG